MTTTVKHRALRAALLAALCLAAGGAPLAADAPAQAQAPEAAAAPADAVGTVRPLDRIVAVVNSDVITEYELQQRVREAALSLRRQEIELPPMEQLRAQVLDRLISERALLQRAEEMGIRVDQQMVTATVEQIARNNKLTVDELRSRLQADGTSMDAFRVQIHNEILTQRLREAEVDSKIDIPESEVDAYLAEKAGFTGSSTTEYRVQHILLPFDPADGAAGARAQETAEDLAERAEKGEDFAKLAASYSRAEDALSGGDLGWRDPSRLPTLYWEALRGGDLRTGHVAVTNSEQAWHVLRVSGVRDGLQAKLAGEPVDQYHLRSIVLFTSNVTAEAEQLQRLNDIRHKVLSGEGDFATYARLYSVDKAATRGGDMGWLQSGDIPPEIESVVKTLEPGQMTEPVRTKYGYYLVQLVEKKKAVADAGRTRLAARAALREKKLAEAVFNWQRELRDKAFVEIRSENL